MKFPEFSRFSRPLKQSFPYSYNVKTRCNEPPYSLAFLVSRALMCCVAFLFLCRLFTPSVAVLLFCNASSHRHCTAHTNWLRHRNITNLIFKNFQSVFQISMSFPELKNPWVFHVFQSCKHPVIGCVSRSLWWSGHCDFEWWLYSISHKLTNWNQPSQS